MAAELVIPHSIQALMPEASNASRFSSSSFFHCAFSSAASVPM
jgi:hypothetical protein